jgi:hypothetical protein
MKKVKIELTPLAVISILGLLEHSCKSNDEIIKEVGLIAQKEFLDQAVDNMSKEQLNQSIDASVEYCDFLKFLKTFKFPNP